MIDIIKFSKIALKFFKHQLHIHASKKVTFYFPIYKSVVLILIIFQYKYEPILHAKFKKKSYFGC